MANSSNETSLRVTVEVYCPKYPTSSQMPSALGVSYTINAALNIPLVFAAVLGNSLMLVALPKSSSLHPPSKALLASLALTDLAVGLVAQPLYITYLLSCREQDFELIRRLSHAYPLGYSLAFVSCFIMTAISLDRFLALRLKRRYREVVTLTRVKCSLAVIWIFGLLLVILGLRVETRFTYFALLVVVVPLCTVVSSVAFLTIYRKLRQQEEICVVIHAFPMIQLRSEQLAAERRLNSSGYRTSVATMVYIYSALLLCYLPFFFLSIALRVIHAWPPATWLPVRSFTQTLVFLKSSLNPVLYCWRIRDVRRVAKKLVKHLCSCGSG